MTFTHKEIESQLLTITREFLKELEAERALQGITLDASLERDLGIDSLGKVELFRRIEKKFSIQLSESSMAEAESLHDLIEKIAHAHGIVQPQPGQRLDAPLNLQSLDLNNAKTLVDVIFSSASQEPNRAHLYLQNEQGKEQVIRYGQLRDEGLKIARGLYKRGIQPGETIAIMLPTSDAFFYSFCGVLMAGAVPVPIYPPFRPDRIEEYAKRETKILHNAQARMLITFAKTEMLSNILRTFVPSLKEIVTVNHLQLSEGPLPPLSIEPQDAALIQYTSGSTGDPKGVFLLHENILANIRSIGKAIPIRPTDVGVSWLPLYHDMGLMNWLASMYSGIPTTILSPLTFLTRPERWLWAIHYHRATLSGGPNFAYELCVKKIDPKTIEGLDLSSWRFAFNGAENINSRTMEHFFKKFSPYGFKMEAFAPVYGLAESTVGLTFPPPRDTPYIDKIEREKFEKENKAIPALNNKDALEFVSCGKAIIDHQIRIVDDLGNRVADRIVGNLQFQGPSSMQGYFNNPQATQKIYHDGWWDTGDLGYIVENELFVTGRKKDLIIKAGRNLYPAEVEEIVSQLPHVRKGCVVAFGINDAQIGTEKLVVVAESYHLKKEHTQALRTEIIEKMAIELGIPPDIVIIVPPKTVPKTSSGKLQRSLCKQAYIEGKLIKQPLPARWQILKLACMSFSKKVYNWFTVFGKFLYTLYVGIIIFITLPFVYLSINLLSRHNAAKIVRFWARNLFRLVFCPIHVKGEISRDKNQSLIFVANHASYIDALLLIGLLPPESIFTAKKEVLHTPIIKTFVKKLDYLTIDRIDFLKNLEIKKIIGDTLQKGRSVVIFPEGTFTYATGLRPFKLGAFTLAVETKKSICPISIQGSRSILRGSSLLLNPSNIKITIGKLISPKGGDWNEVIRVHALARAEIAKHCGEPVIDVIVAGPVID